MTIKVLFTYHTSGNSNGSKVLKFGHIPPSILVDGVDKVTHCRPERYQQENLINVHKYMYRNNIIVKKVN